MLTRLFALAGASALVAGIVIGCGTDTVPNSPTDDGGTNNSPDGGDASTGKPDAATDAGDAGTTPVETFAIGVTVSGLHGTGLVLQNNGGDDLSVNADGTFAFATKLAKGATFAVSVKNQPTAPSQTCTVTGGTGTVGSGNVTTVVVDCDTNKFSVSGSVSGLHGHGLVLQNNAGGDITMNADGTFAFAATVADDTAYAVTVKTQPTNLSQTCSVVNGSGTIASADVTAVAVTCVTNKFDIGGTVTGLDGSGLILQNNAGDDFSVTGNGTFTFGAQQFDGTDFAVTVKTNPTDPVQTCSVSGGNGTLAGGHVKSVTVNCSTKAFAVGGSVSGLEGGGLVLQNNGGDDIPITAVGDFAFPTAIADHGGYAVTVKTQPTSKWQTCTVTDGSGTIASAVVSNVGVVCTTNKYKVKVDVSGLEGTGLVLQNNAGDNLPVATDGTVAFVAPVESGDDYLVTVLTNPSGKSQTCTVSNGVGTIEDSDIADVTVACVTNKYTLGGSVTGLAGTGLVLQNNGEDLPVDENGDFTFANELESGAAFDVTVKTQPWGLSQKCAVAGGKGTVAAGNVVSVSVNCTTNLFTITGQVHLLDGTGLVLQNNGVDLPINLNGDFAFPPQMDGTAYDVTVKTQPTLKSQTCTVVNGTSTVSGDNVTNISVDCTTNTYDVGGTLSGLGSGTIVLTNNGGDDLELTANGDFKFGTKVASGAAYAVAIKSQPASQSCTVSSDSGTVISSAVANVTVSCGCALGYLSSGSMCILAPIGGTVTNIGGYRIHTFTSSGTFVAPSDVNVEYLIVAGGGGGGSGDGAGGGAGGLLTGTTLLATNNFAIVVGAGGAGAGFGEIGTASKNGTDSSFAGFVAVGGGRGGQEDNTGGAGPLNLGGDGGSGGGFGSANAPTNGAPGNGTPGQGHKGGVRGATANKYGMGGGGGAGADGGNGGNSNEGGAGGVGFQSSISGTPTFYAGGGGGSGRSISGGAGGNGGGGAGGLNASGSNATPNTGGGGGGGGDQNTRGGNGGSGIVIIRYPISP